MLVLYLVIDPSGAKVAADLAADATVAELRAAVQQCGGPPPVEQVLVVGGEELRAGGETLLSDTGLSSEAVVHVRRRAGRHKTVSCGAAWGLALLEDGSVASFAGNAPRTPAFACRPVSVHAGCHVGAAILEDETLQLWGAAGSYVGMERVGRVESCSLSAAVQAMAVVHDGGLLSVFGSWARRYTAAMRSAADQGLQGRVVAAAVAQSFLVALTRDGEVMALNAGRAGFAAVLDLGSKKAVSVSAGSDRAAVLLEDGSVHSVDGGGESRCDVPAGAADVVSCAPPGKCTVVCCRDGTAACPVGNLASRNYESAGPCVAVEAGGDIVAFVTAAGGVVLDAHYGGSWSTPDFDGRRVATPLPPR